jgi:hypothetical protein
LFVDALEAAERLSALPPRDHFIDHAFLHYKEDVLGLPDILHRIARHRHYIRELAGLQRSDFVGYSEQIGSAKVPAFSASIGFTKGSPLLQHLFHFGYLEFLQSDTHERRQ